ncbi:uncharacterized protein BDV17DRAFT_292443 [Aspergillus undulatus]|uniref:uncharacterized protein n=1 Tax=Aspergillus undulatus TaxID=1810928 RepID=UPI003CCE32ED
MISKREEKPKVAADDDDEPDDWDKRIFSTGCAVEQDKLNECYWAKKDWRACKDQVSYLHHLVSLLPPRNPPLRDICLCFCLSDLFN